jgi:hypothetical protein
MKKIRDLVILLSVFVIQVLISIKSLDLNYLWFTNLDEWAFHGSMLRIFQGVASFDLKIFYGTGFFNYGHLYFLINSFFSYPFYLIDNTEGLVLVPRIISSVSSIVTIIYIYKLFKYEGEKYLFPLILILSFPSFWINSTIFHPDWPYTCFIIISIYYLSKDKWGFGSNFKISCFFFAVAFSLKIQAITFIPIYLFYLLFSKNTLIEILKNGLFIFVSLVGLRLITNPYLFHPEGFNAFVEGFLADMNSNRTNHGNGTLITVFEKIQMINRYYLSYFSLALISLILVLFSFKKKLKKITLVILLTFIINIGYLLIFVNKAWQHYYLTSFILLVIILNSIINGVKHRTLIYSTIMIFQTAVFYFYFNFSNEKDLSTVKNDVKKVSMWIENNIDKNDSILVLGPVSVDMDYLNINYQNIHRVYGKLNRDHFFKYNNHYPGKNVIKKFFVISKKYPNYNKIKSRIPNQYVLFKEDENVSVYKINKS